MKSIFQNINTVSQAAMTSAKYYVEDHGDDIDEDELDEWLTFTFSEYSFDEVFRELFDESVKLIIRTFQMATGDEG